MTRKLPAWVGFRKEPCDCPGGYTLTAYTRRWLPAYWLAVLRHRLRR